MTERVGTGPNVGPVPPSLVRQRVKVELPCGQCVHHGVCSIEEQIEQDVTLTVVGVGRPVRLYLGCSIYSKRRGTRPIEVTQRIQQTRVARRALHTVHPRTRAKMRMTPHWRPAVVQPLDEELDEG